MPRVSDARLWGSVSRWNNVIEIPSWLLLRAGQVMKMTVKDPILIHVLKATLKRWPTEKLLLEFKAFLIHKHELFARKGSLLGKSYCYSWRRLLSHVNYVICSIGRNCVHENVSHAFLASGLENMAAFKKPHKWMYYLPSYVTLPAGSPSVTWAMTKKR